MILVTGAGGFLGSALIDQLHREGRRIRAIVREARQGRCLPPDVETVVADVRERSRMVRAAAGCHTIIHLAGKAHALDDLGDDHEYGAVNVDGTRNVLEGARAAGTARFLFVSSVKVFGEETDGCIDETAPARPQSPYGRSKWDAECLVADYAARSGMVGLSLRLPLVYGPTVKGNLYRMIRAIDRGWFPPLPRLTTRRSMLHVNNFVQAVRVCLKHKSSSKPVYIAADAHPYSTTEMYESVRRGLGRPVPAWRIPLAALKMAAAVGSVIQTVTRTPCPLTSQTLNKLIGSACYRPDALMGELGYRPTHTFEEAVPELIEHYRKSTTADARTCSP